MKKVLSFLVFTIIALSGFSQLRISQVYGGGGSASGTYKHDYVELFNAGATSVSLNGLSIQYASSGGNFTAVCVLPAAASVPAGGYYLVQMTTGAGTGINNLPTPDATASSAISMAAGQGKVVLVNGTTALNVACPGTYIDLVGYGTSTTVCNETAPVGTLSATTAALRNSNGCTDTNNNSSDFTIGAPTPRNSATAPNPCGGGAALSLSSVTPSMLAVVGNVSNEATFTVSGSGLTGAPGNIAVSVTGNVEVSLTSGSGFSSSVNVPYASASLSATTLYARIKNTAPLGPVSETITAAGGGAATNPTTTASGNVIEAEPTTQATNIIISNNANNSFDVNWTNGNGTSRIVVARQTTASEVVPADGVGYTVGGTTGTGNVVIFNGTGTGPVTASGLIAGTSYTVRVYEYNGSGGTANYNTTTDAGNPAVSSTTGVSPNMQQINFTGVSVPLYMAGNGGRLPTMFYATVSNLVPNTAYRYYVLGSATTDLNTSNSGAGLPILIDYNNANAFYYPTTASLNAAGQYGTFTTNASGSFTGSFGFTSSSNARFTVGNTVYPAITLQKETSSAVENRFQLNQGITVLGYGATATDATYIKGASSSTAKNLVALWKSIDGSSFTAATARPLSMTVTEATGATGTGNYGTSFIAGYDLTAGAWNTLIPNNNPAGVELIQQLDILTGSTIGCNSDPDGTWPSGAVTANPAGGTTAITLTSGDAPLTGGACFSIVAVNYNNFTAVKSGNGVKLSWTTQQEANSDYTEVLRSTDGVNWKAISNVPAAGNSSVQLYYNAFDNAPAAGRNLYKLRFVDVSGRSTYSDIRTVLFSDKFEISVSPNPVRDVITINIAKQDNATPVIISLVNSNGKIVGSYTTQSGTYSINAAGFAKGLYVLKLTSGSYSATEKLIIQ